MFRIFVLILIFSCKTLSNSILCSNGRPAIQLTELNGNQASVRCSTPGEFCAFRIGRCSKELLCCPDNPKMSDQKVIRDRATNINFKRIGEDFRETYRLFQLKLKPMNQSKSMEHFRWLFFEETLRDLFEMPKARFRNAIINCMEKNGLAIVMVPLGATSIITNISAMTIISRKPESPLSIDVCYLATRKEHRRRGLGTRLIQEIVQYALTQRVNNVWNMIIQVNTLNTVALELYERCGWRCSAYLPHYLDPDPHHSTNHAFSLILPLHHVKNISTLCRDPSAIEPEIYYDQMSIEICHRKPIRFF